MKVSLTEEQRTAIIADLRAGRSYREMTRKFGVSDYVIRETGRRAGLALRGPGKRPPEQHVRPGQTFTRWVVVEAARPGSRAAICRCQCGQVRNVRVRSLLSGWSRSCGCLKREASGERIGRIRRTHGLSSHPLYARWELMMRRCHDPDSDSFRWYGERGIAVHESLRSPEGYIRCVEALEVPAGLIGNHDVTSALGLSSEQRDWLYQEFTIDRVDNNGNYEPGNLRWADWETQRANQRQPKSIGKYGFLPHDF